jgi:hypothetical protein
VNEEATRRDAFDPANDPPPVDPSRPTFGLATEQPSLWTDGLPTANEGEESIGPDGGIELW